MKFSSIVGLSAIAGVASAKTCYNATVQIDVSARNGVFGKAPVPQTNEEATAFALSATRQGGNGTAAALTGYATVSGRYNISTQYCKPDNTDSKGQVLQILTHGVGFDKTYWDLPYNNFNYSYVDHALSQGYHTFAYDRLGVGNSSHGEPKNEIQAFLEIESLAEITRQLRKGSLSGVQAHPEKIVHVGHSFGSTQTYALTAKYPDISDGIVLTGFSMNATYLPLFLAGANFQQAKLDRTIANRSAKSYVSGYLTNANINSNAYLFFYPAHYDPKILHFAEKSKQPVTIGELLTVGSLPLKSEFAGPVLVVTGSNDLPFCGGDCLATGGAAPSIPAAAKAVFPAATKFSAVVQPNTGHGLNFHYNATAGYKSISSFLSSQNLSAKKN